MKYAGGCREWGGGGEGGVNIANLREKGAGRGKYRYTQHLT